jgi:hypothetical protein
MKKLWALPLLFALACSTTTTSSAPPAKRPAETRVNVTIESRPDAAEAFVNGKFIGTTPLSARLAPGDHTIEVRHPERASWKRELTVLPESPTRVMALLQK